MFLVQITLGILLLRDSVLNVLCVALFALTILSLVLVLLVAEGFLVVASRLVDFVSVVGILVLLVLTESSHLVCVVVLSPLQDISCLGLLTVHLLSELFHFLIVTTLLARHLLVMPLLHILHIVSELFHFLIMPVLSVAFCIVHLVDLSLMSGLHISCLLDVLLLTSRLVAVQLSQFFLMVTVSLLERSGSLLLHALDLVKVLLFLLCQGLIVRLLIFLRFRIFVCFLFEMLLIGFLHLFEMRLLLGSDLLLEILDLFAKPVNFLQGLIVFGVVGLRVDGDLLARFDDVRLEIAPVVLGRLDVCLVIFHLFLDIRQGCQFVIECNQSSLHALNLGVAVSKRELQVLDLFVERIDLCSCSRRTSSGLLVRGAGRWLLLLG